jgi:hypothetical protein
MRHSFDRGGKEEICFIKKITRKHQYMVFHAKIIKIAKLSYFQVVTEIVFPLKFLRKRNFLQTFS